MYKHLHTLVVQDRPEIALAEHPYEVGIEVIWRNGSCISNLNLDAITVQRINA